jgi:hypothetical protein
MNMAKKYDKIFLISIESGIIAYFASVIYSLMSAIYSKIKSIFMLSKYKSDNIIIIIISVIVLLLPLFLMEPMQHISRSVGGSLSSSSYSSSFSSSLLLINQVANALDDRNVRLSATSNANGTLTIVTVSNNGSFLPSFLVLAILCLLILLPAAQETLP